MQIMHAVRYATFNLAYIAYLKARLCFLDFWSINILCLWHNHLKFYPFFLRELEISEAKLLFCFVIICVIFIINMLHTCPNFLVLSDTE